MVVQHHTTCKSAVLASVASGLDDARSSDQACLCAPTHRVRCEIGWLTLRVQARSVHSYRCHLHRKRLRPPHSTKLRDLAAFSDLCLNCAGQRMTKSWIYGLPPLYWAWKMLYQSCSPCFSCLNCAAVIHWISSGRCSQWRLETRARSYPFGALSIVSFSLFRHG